MVERALDIEERALGADHSNAIASRAWMAELLRKQGFLNKASRLLEEVVSALERVQGFEHPDYASAVSNWAVLLENQVRAVRILHETFRGAGTVVTIRKFQKFSYCAR